MIKLLLKTFVKNSENVKDKKVRESYSVLSGVVGLICNFVLFVVKFIIGTVTGSLAVVSDAMNTLSDTGSSLISILGAKLANKKADKDHPFGHGRYEYIASLIISFIILFMGFELLTGSIDKIKDPQPIDFQVIPFIILGATMLVKVWMYSYNKYMSKKINSKILLAAAKDSIADVLSTVVVLIATIIGHFTGYAIVDGILGLLMSFLIMHSGFEIAKDVIDTLLGKAPEQELVDELSSLILSDECVVGIHDLIVHDYGPGRHFASVHAEVSDDCDIVYVHEKIDAIEVKAMNELGVMLVIHTDPVSTNNETVDGLKQMVSKIVSDINPDYSIHDFRITDGQNNKNLIFDVVAHVGISEKEKTELRNRITSDIEKNNAGLSCVITVDTPFV